MSKDFENATENAIVMASHSRAMNIKGQMQSHYDTSTKKIIIPSDTDKSNANDCIDYIKEKYNKVFGKSESSIAIKAYTFSNENVTDMFKNLNVKDKNILVVGSSADQAIAAVMGGAKCVTLADKNPLAKYFGKLKIAALTILNKKEFEEYLCNEISAMNLNVKYYKKFSHLLDQETRDFWDNMYMEYSGAEIASAIFHDNVVKLECIPYLASDTQYHNAQENLKNNKINYVITDILDFHNHIGQVDIILLSNIIDYIDNKNDKKFGEELNLLKAKLSPGGIIQYEYSWGPKHLFNNSSALSQSERKVIDVKKYLKGGSFHQMDLHISGEYPNKQSALYYVKGKYGSNTNNIHHDNQM